MPESSRPHGFNSSRPGPQALVDPWWCRRWSQWSRQVHLARELAGPLQAVVLAGDDFFAGGVTVRSDTARERAEACIDRPRQRHVLKALRRSERATWRRFNWTIFDGSLESELRSSDPAPVILFEGVYSARPELSDLVDFRVLLRVPA